VLGHPELITDPRFVSIPTRRLNQPPLRALLEPVVAARAVDELVAELGAGGVPVGRVNTKASLAADTQVRHNGLLRDTHYPGIGPLRTPRAAAQFIGLPHDDTRRAPHLGEHSRAVLRERGHSEAAIEALFSGGAVR
jgi:CoA:oxalate CoA-transferase